jgi:hypothetical protein
MPTALALVGVIAIEIKISISSYFLSSNSTAFALPPTTSIHVAFYPLHLSLQL